MAPENIGYVENGDPYGNNYRDIWAEYSIRIGSEMFNGFFISSNAF